jgi:hypothetical protein
MEKKAWMVRQGDVALVRVETAPKGATEVPRENGGVVLAHGEATGHVHQFRDPGVCMLRREGVSAAVVSIVDAEALLVHEEHATIPVPPGHYEVRRQVEYTPEELRNVAD